jgi:hypothetical protein
MDIAIEAGPLTTHEPMYKVECKAARDRRWAREVQ